MPKVPRIANNLDIRVGSRDLAEDCKGRVAGRVVDENMLVAVFAEAQHQIAHAFVQFADVTLFVEAGRDYADGLHCVQSTHLPPPALAAWAAGFAGRPR